MHRKNLHLCNFDPTFHFTLFASKHLESHSVPYICHVTVFYPYHFKILTSKREFLGCLFSFVKTSFATFFHLRIKVIRPETPKLIRPKDRALGETGPKAPNRTGEIRPKTPNRQWWFQLLNTWFLRFWLLSRKAKSDWEVYLMQSLLMTQLGQGQSGPSIVYTFSKHCVFPIKIPPYNDI